MEYQVQENCLTIYLPAEVDHHNAEEMKRKADKLIDRNHIKYVIFDFENTDFMDSYTLPKGLLQYPPLLELVCCFR